MSGPSTKITIVCHDSVLCQIPSAVFEQPCKYTHNGVSFTINALHDEHCVYWSHMHYILINKSDYSGFLDKRRTYCARTADATWCEHAPYDLSRADELSRLFYDALVHYGLIAGPEVVVNVSVGGVSREFRRVDGRTHVVDTPDGAVVITFA